MGSMSNAVSLSVVTGRTREETPPSEIGYIPPSEGGYIPFLLVEKCTFHVTFATHAQKEIAVQTGIHCILIDGVAHRTCF